MSRARQEEAAFRKALENLPDKMPRPLGELEQLKKVWEPPKGWRALSAVNNSYIGTFYTGAALLFFILGGVLALIMRTQLAAPMAEVVSQETYNQLFTMHGTIMMFLFAVPAVESLGVLLLPQMLAARDLPFPRLSAFAFWAYLFGGLAFYCSLFFKVAPDGGWFMYPPLTSAEYSPGINADFWLLGIGFIEISAIAGAIEIVVGILRTRTPGMTLANLPVFAWAMLVFAAMVILGFPAIILGTALLEIERTFDWPFFISHRGGDPMLWQHLFWFFGHPEVYIIFLPAAGLMSMIIPMVARARLVAYPLVILALITTGTLAFGVWVHHMYATGIPAMSVSFFSAASMMVSVPAGIQIFAWIATLATGRVKWTVPALFSVAFLITFTMGGLTGVMVAMVPFDWQAHDTHFVVAHLHYVLIGGMVFPLFAAIYTWIPMISNRPLSEKLGRWVFGLIVGGFHVAFLVMHWTGLRGMPRRVFTYPDGLGLNDFNLISTIGAYMIGAGVLLFLFDLARNFRFAPADGEVGNVYGAGTLEWLPSDNYGFRSLPYVTSREPLWDRPELSDEVEKGQWFLPGTPTNARETIVGSPIGSIPQYLMRLPGPGWDHFLAAIATAAFFLMLTVQLYWWSIPFGVAAIAFVFRWVWELDPGRTHDPVEVGGGLKLPVYATGPRSHAWWAVAVLNIVLAMIFACLVFSYFFLWSNQPGGWTPYAVPQPSLASGLVVLGLYLIGIILMAFANHLMGRGSTPATVPLAVGAVLALIAAVAVDTAALAATGLEAKDSGYGAVVYMFQLLEASLGFTLLLMVGFVVARWLGGRLHPERRLAFDCTRQLFYYAAGQGLITFLLLRLFPLVSA
jgi:cytochrome c oxidase subunit I+III